MSIPPGFTRCEMCGEFNGTTKAKYLDWAGFTNVPDPEDEVSVGCLCRGVQCRLCGQIRIHRPLSRSYLEPVNMIVCWSVLTGLLPCAECRANQSGEWRALKQPASDEIVNIVAGPEPEVSEWCYRVVRRSRMNEPVVFPEEDDLEDALENDPDLLDRDALIDLLYDEGETVFKHQWDSGGPGAGAGVEYIQELDGRFYYFCDWAGLYGPYDTIDEALDGNKLLLVNSATKGIESRYHSTEELIHRIDFNGESCIGHEFLVNWESCVCLEPGKIVRLEEDEIDTEQCR